MKRCLTLLHLFFCTAAIQAQQNHFVSPSGNNGNSGQLISPWKTIQYAINAAAANDTINILAGTYNERVQISKPDLFIRNYQDDTVVLSGTGITTQVAMVEVSNSSNLTIQGLEIANNALTDAQGILVEGSGKNILIENCVLHDIHFSSNPNAPVNSGTNAQGIIVYGTNGSTPIRNIRIINNKLYNCRLGYSEGIAVNGNVDDFEISGNEVHDLTNIGIDAIGHEGTSPNAATDQARNGFIKRNRVYNCVSPYATSAGIYVDGGKNIVIENNISYHNGYGVEVGCENKGKTTDSIVVRSNIFYDNEICAVALGGYDYPANSGKVINSIIRNNTCYKNDYSNNGTGELYLSYSENSVIENNIFYLSAQNTLAYAELEQPSLIFNYNIFFSDNSPADMSVSWNGPDFGSFAAFQVGSSTNADSKLENPGFLNSNGAPPDFHISITSPAKDAGNPSFVPDITERDMDNELRLATGVVDCGADEYYSSVIIYTFIGNGNWSNAANWSNGIKPPAITTGNARIVIEPANDGECILDIEQRIVNGAYLIVQPGKKFTVVGNISISN